MAAIKRGRFSPGQSLSRREIDVLRLMASGKQTKEIASELFISWQTVKTHLADLYYKLGAVNAPHAVGIAISSGVITSDDILPGSVTIQYIRETNKAQLKVNTPATKSLEKNDPTELGWTTSGTSFVELNSTMCVELISCEFDVLPPNTRGSVYVELSGWLARRHKGLTRKMYTAILSGVIVPDGLLCETGQRVSVSISDPVVGEPGIGKELRLRWKRP